MDNGLSGFRNIFTSAIDLFYSTAVQLYKFYSVTVHTTQYILHSTPCFQTFQLPRRRELVSSTRPVYTVEQMNFYLWYTWVLDNIKLYIGGQIVGLSTIV